jgi:hypothetical protein
MQRGEGVFAVLMEVLGKPGAEEFCGYPHLTSP